MNEKTNLEKIPVLTNGEFLAHLHASEEDLTMIRENLFRRIVAELNSILHFEAVNESAYCEPDFHKGIELCEELYRSGFKFEAYKYMTELGKLINELYSHHMQLWRLNARQFHSYVVPSFLGWVKPNRLFPVKIELENFVPAGPCMRVSYREKHKDEYEDGLIFMDDLKQHAVDEGLLVEVSDWPDHMGEHVQKELKSSLARYVQERMDDLIKSYLESGKEIYPA